MYRSQSTITVMDLALQGDPGTLESDAAAAAFHLPARTELLAMWEEQRVISTRLNFTDCRDEWAALSPEQRKTISSAIHGLKRIDRDRVPLMTGLGSRAPELLDESALWGTFVSDTVRHVRLLERFCRDARTGASNLPDGLDEVLGEQFAAISQAVRSPEDRDELRALAADALGVVGIVYLGLALFLSRDLRRHDGLKNLSRALDRIVTDKHRYVAYACLRLREGRDEGSGPIAFADLGAARNAGSELTRSMCAMVPADGFLGDDAELVGRCHKLTMAALERRLLAAGDSGGPADDPSTH